MSVDLFFDALRLDIWSRRSLEAIQKYQLSRGIPPLKKQRWQRALATYIIELTNFKDDNQRLYSELVGHLVKQTDIPFSEINTILQKDHEMPIVEGSISLRASMKTQSEVLISIEPETGPPLKINMPLHKWLEIRDNESQVLADLLLRYHMMGFNTGLFWGVAKGIKELLEEDTLPIVECFASPLNFTVERFCTAFAGDCDIKYADRSVECHVDFLKYIGGLSVTRSLIFNPPYSRQVLTTSCERLRDYIVRCPECKVVAMLPVWFKAEAILSLPNIEEHTIPEGKCKVFDFATNQTIIPSGLSVRIICYDGTNSQRLLDRVLQLSEISD